MTCMTTTTTYPKADLLRILRLVKKHVGRPSAHFHPAGHVRLTAFDLSIATGDMDATFSVDGAGDNVSLVLDHGQLAAGVGATKDGHVAITSTSGGNAQVGSMMVSGGDPDLWQLPVASSDRWEYRGSEDGAVLVAKLDRLIPCASRNDYTPVLQTVYFDGEHGSLVACDRYRLHVEPSPLLLTAAVPLPAVELLAGACKGKRALSGVEVYQAGELVKFAGPAVSIIARTHQTPYPSYLRLLPADQPYHSLIDVPELLEALDAFKLGVRGRGIRPALSPPLRIDTTVPGVATLSASVDGDVFWRTTISFGGDPLGIVGFDAAFLRQMATSCAIDGKLRIDHGRPHRPVSVISTGQPGYRQHVLMPTRLEESA